MDTIHAAQAYAILMTALGSLIITFIALAAKTANHCVWINGVCFDRPQGGYVYLESSLDVGLRCWRAMRENILDTPCLHGAAGAQHQPSLAAETRPVVDGLP